MKATYHILHTEWSNGWGGQEIRILNECLGMRARGHLVELAGVAKGQLAQKAKAQGLTFHHVEMRGPWDVLALNNLMNLLRRHSFEIIHTHSSVDSWLGGMAGRLLGRGVVRTRHLSVPVSRHPLNLVYRLPQAVITTGQGICQHLVNDYGLPEERVISIPTGIDPALFYPQSPDPILQQELGLDPQAPVIATVAVLRSWKRHDLFCQMAAQVLQKHPDARFLIVGDGPGRQRVEGYLRDMNLESAVIMTGHRDDIPRILSLCTICILASDRAEGVSQAILQQLACGKAVIAAAAGSSPEIIIPEKTGLLVEPGKLAPLTQAVLRLLENPRLGQTCGQEGRQLVLANYTLDCMLDATEQVYAKVIPMTKFRSSFQANPHA